MSLPTSLLVAGALALGPPPQDTAAPSPIVATRAVTTGGREVQADYGRLSVPERRADPEARAIEVAFVRLRGPERGALPPLVYLPGPPEPATPLAERADWTPMLARRDVLLFDQRGLGHSRPPLAWAAPGWRAERLLVDEASAVEHVVATCREAAAALGERGFDLAGYSVAEVADDLDDLRRALGYERLALVGHSGGSHLALAYLRRHAEHVERVVSLSTSGLDAIHQLPGELDEGLDRLTALGAPLDLREAFEAALAELEREPLAVPVRAADGTRREVAVGPFGLQLVVMLDLADTADVPVLPRLLHQVARRDPTLLAWFVDKRLAQLAQPPLHLFASRAPSGASPARWERLREQAERSPFGDARCFFSPHVERALGLPDLGEAFRAPLESDVPALFVSGTLDAQRPPQETERVRAGFRRSGHVVVEHGGHEGLLGVPEVRRRVLAFLEGGPPEDARAEAPAPRFAPLEEAPGDVDHPALRGGR